MSSAIVIAARVCDLLCRKRLGLERREVMHVSRRLINAMSELVLLHARAATQLEEEKAEAVEDKIAKVAVKRKENMRAKQAEAVRAGARMYPRATQKCRACNGVRTRSCAQLTMVPPTLGGGGGGGGWWRKRLPAGGWWAEA